jgi:hypothetical protein
LALLLVPTSVKADEGMWFLMFIERLNHLHRYAKVGLIDRRNLQHQQCSLKDAIVQFNGGCCSDF